MGITGVFFCPHCQTEHLALKDFRDPACRAYALWVEKGSILRGSNGRAYDCRAMPTPRPK